MADTKKVFELGVHILPIFIKDLVLNRQLRGPPSGIGF